tara:strand:+ start:178 stop:363 length:186 start_codon:yes stop_codon:yes gene_type:complete
LKRIVFVIAVAAVSAVAVPFVSPFLTDVLAQTVNGGVKFGHCGGAKVGQFGASALERAALI